MLRKLDNCMQNESRPSSYITHKLTQNRLKVDFLKDVYVGKPELTPFHEYTKYTTIYRVISPEK